MTATFLFIALTCYAPPVDAAAEERSIREFLVTRQDAFNREDAKWLASHFVENGEFVNSSGTSVKGRDNIEKTYRALFDSPPHHGVTTVHAIEEIRCVTDDAAIVVGNWRLSGLKDQQGRPLPDRRGRSIIIVVKVAGEWMIDLLRADLKVPEAAAKSGTVDVE